METAPRGPPALPPHVVVIGAGRWARVILGVLADICSSQVRLTVHSPNHHEEVQQWLGAKGLHERVRAVQRLPPLGPSDAVIIANAAGDHEMSALTAVQAGASVLIEKPIALSLAGAERIDRAARQAAARCAPAHVFAFAPRVARFATLLGEAGNTYSLDLIWTDPVAEQRHGEPKRYDPRLPVFQDVLPHVCAMVSVVAGAPPSALDHLVLFRGGARVDLRMRVGDVPVTVRMERNAEKRKRIVRARMGDAQLELDLSEEPGTIRTEKSEVILEPHTLGAPRPMTAMLSAFLVWAAGGRKDPRLDMSVALRSCAIVDACKKHYRAAMRDILLAPAALASQEDLHYARTELAYASGARDEKASRAWIEALERDIVQGTGETLQEARRLLGGP